MKKLFMKTFLIWLMWLVASTTTFAKISESVIEPTKPSNVAIYTSSDEKIKINIGKSDKSALVVIRDEFGSVVFSKFYDTKKEPLHIIYNLTNLDLGKYEVQMLRGKEKLSKKIKIEGSYNISNIKKVVLVE